ncbi:MAG: phospho-N-acetylmuramoyl-pentapeptide-transferase, partial [Aeromicrobium sp.]
MKAILIAGALALMITLIGTRFAISVLVKQGYGQLIRDDGPTSHHTKRGTPTMGGLVVIVAVVIGYFTAKLATNTAPSASALLLLFLFAGLGMIGFLDDYIKVSKQRNLGLRSKAKLIGQTLIGLIFAVAAIGWEDDTGRTPITHAISFTRDIQGWKLPTALLIIWV